MDIIRILCVSCYGELFKLLINCQTPIDDGVRAVSTSVQCGT